MIFIFWTVLGLAVGAFHALRKRDGRAPGETAAIFLRWFLGITIGLGSIVGALFHIFDGVQTAEEIGFTRGDGGFQFENAMGDLAIGVAAFSCIWIREKMFWAAVILISTIQFWGDAYGHVYQMVENDNHKPDNTGPVLWMDILNPILAIIFFGAMKRFSPKSHEV